MAGAFGALAPAGHATSRRGSWRRTGRSSTCPGSPAGLGERGSIGMPGLAVDADVLASSWVISTEEVEGEVPPGVHRLLRFSVTLPNHRRRRPSMRRCQWICADSRVHTPADMLFRFYVHTPGKSRSVLDRKTEVKNAISRLCSLRSMGTTNV